MTHLLPLDLDQHLLIGFHWWQEFFWTFSGESVNGARRIPKLAEGSLFCTNIDLWLISWWYLLYSQVCVLYYFVKSNPEDLQLDFRVVVISLGWICLYLSWNLMDLVVSVLFGEKISLKLFDLAPHSTHCWHEFGHDFVMSRDQSSSRNLSNQVLLNQIIISRSLSSSLNPSRYQTIFQSLQASWSCAFLWKTYLTSIFSFHVLF